MKNHLVNHRHLHTAAVAMCGVLFGSVCHADHYKVYLLGGQSNAAGRGDASELSAPYDSPQTNVAFYWHSTLTGTINGNLTQDTWVDLQPDSGEGKNNPSGHAVEFGPELAFGRTMADADSSVNIAIIKYAHGGSNLHTQWAEGGEMYQMFLTTVSEALAALTNAGHTYELIGMFWQQGEADTGDTNANNYEENLTDLIARVRTDVFGGLNLPFVIGGLSSNQYSTIMDATTGAGKVRLAQETVPTNVDGCGFANADSCEVYADNNIHFNYAGQLALGAAHAAEMIRLEALDLDCDGLSADQETALETDPENPDSDGDGQKDGFEFRAGTNPTNAASFFQISSVVVSSNAVELAWPSKAGNTYRVEHSESLAEWADVEEVPAVATGSNTLWTSVINEEPGGVTNILALYDAASGLNGNFNTTGFDSADTESVTTASRMVQGGSLNGGGKSAFVLTHGIFGSTDSPSTGFNLAGSALSSQAAAAAEGDWFAFTISSGGNTVDYTALSFFTDQYGTGGKLDISYTVNGTETFVLQDHVMLEGNVNLALTSVDFADFSTSNDVVWTFYLYGASADNYGNRFDDITLYGTSDALLEEPEEASTGFYRINLQ